MLSIHIQSRNRHKVCVPVSHMGKRKENRRDNVKKKKENKDDTIKDGKDGLFENAVRACVCVCVVIPFILDVRLVDAPAGVTQEEGHTQDFSTFLLLRCLLYFFSREAISRSSPSSTVKSNFVYPRINRSPLVGHYFFLFW